MIICPVVVQFCFFFLKLYGISQNLSFLYYHVFFSILIVFDHLIDAKAPQRTGTIYLFLSTILFLITLI